MTQVMEADDFLAHFGVKGMKWGVRKERRQENRVARAKTRTEVRKINSIKTTQNEADIKKAREALSEAQRRKGDAKDQYKVDKHTMNKIDAKRPYKIAAADLRRIQDQADQLTPKERDTFEMMQLGRSVGDLFTSSKNQRSDFQRLMDKERDKQRAREKHS